jgi:tetratricopeptide (TPR) repeat protein
MTDEMVEKMPLIEGFVPTRLFTLARFHKWDQILAEKSPNEKFTYAKGIWHYARGLAFAGQGKRSEAQAEADKLHAIHAATPEDKMLMQHHAQDLLAIAANHLDGVLLADAGKVDDAAAKLRLAVDQADKLQYDEPPPWYLPMRQPLGALLLAANRPAEAEAAYRADLKIYAENGWSLAGLAKALRAQKRDAEAAEVEARFKKAWATAEIEPF